MIVVIYTSNVNINLMMEHDTLCRKTKKSVKLNLRFFNIWL